MDTSGFYSAQDGVLLHAPNFVHAPGFSLTRDTHVQTPSAGDWAWFDTEEDARAVLGIPAQDLNEADALLREVLS